MSGGRGGDNIGINESEGVGGEADIKGVDEARFRGVREGAGDIAMPCVTDDSKSTTHSVEALTTRSSVDIGGGELINAAVGE
jgi:hypothetical protein